MICLDDEGIPMILHMFHTVMEVYNDDVNVGMLMSRSTSEDPV